MSEFKIENKSVEGKSSKGRLKRFAVVAASLKVGQSFEVKTMTSYERNAVSVVEAIMGINLTTRKTPGGYRVGRVS